MASFEHEIDALLARAEELLQDDQAEEALAVVEEAAVLDPGHPWVGLLRGAALGRLERAEEAVPVLLGAADAHPEDVDLQIAAAHNLCALEEAQDALICARRASSLDATNAAAQAVLGECLELLGRSTEAIPAREAAITLDAEDEENRFHLALDLSEAGRYEEALTIITPLASAHDDDPDVARVQGACYAYLGQHEEALRCWDTVERLDGVNAYTLHNRASSLAAGGNYDEALTLIDQAVAEDPSQVIHYYTRGMILEKKGDARDAVEAYLEALTVAPEDVDCAVNLVDAATENDLVEEALSGVEALLASSDSELGTVDWGLGSGVSAEEDEEGSDGALPPPLGGRTRVSDLLVFGSDGASPSPSAALYPVEPPGTAALHYARGRLLLELDDVVGARIELETTLRQDPALGVAWYALSMVCGIIGEYEASLAAADRALRSFPDDPGLWLNRGQALHELHRFPEAVASYDHLTELAPEDWSSWFHLGRLLLLDLQRAADARGVLEEAVRLQPDNDATRWLLALCYLRLGRHADADRELQPVLGSDPNHLWGRLVRAALRAQRGEKNLAMEDIAVATGQGYDARLLLEEPLFKPLWDLPRFRRLTGRRRRGRD